MHRLTHRDDGSPRCVACLCCSTACPRSASTSSPPSTPSETPAAATSVTPAEFVIDELRCIFCGFCVEACPCDAIRMDTGIHMTALDNRADFIFDKAKLMSVPSVKGEFKSHNSRHEPGDPSFPGIDRLKGHH
ncbi:MAG: 4Fe-4S binding protein [Polyangiales bacterium]